MKALGYFKDECNGVAPIQFVGLRAKMYSLLLPGGKTKKTAKGVQRSFVEKKVSHDQYLTCLQTSTRTSATFHAIRCHDQELFTEKQAKIALSPFDDKRYLLPSTHVSSSPMLAYGHWRIKDIIKGGGDS